MEKRWKIATAASEEVEALQRSLQVHPTICSILVQRGLKTYEAAKAFFRPQLSELHDPFLMKDMHKAVERILLAFENQEKIPWCDGFTTPVSTARSDTDR